jgi:hypothetical protein
MRAMNEIVSKIAIAALADAEQARLAAGRLAGRQSEPRRQSRPRRKALALPTAAASAVALIVPIPGIVAKRRTGSSFRAIWTNSLSKTAIRSSSAPFGAQVFD